LYLIINSYFELFLNYMYLLSSLAIKGLMLLGFNIVQVFLNNWPFNFGYNWVKLCMKLFTFLGFGINGKNTKNTFRGVL